MSRCRLPLAAACSEPQFTAELRHFSGEEVTSHGVLAAAGICSEGHEGHVVVV
jgi:hypothetical protein